MSDSLVGETLCSEGKSCLVYPNLFLCLFVYSGVQEVVVGYYSLVSFGFYPKEDLVVDLLQVKPSVLGVIVLPIPVPPRGVVIVISLSLSIIWSARSIVLRISGVTTLIVLIILIWSSLVRIAPFINIAICLGIIPSSFKVLFRAKTPILRKLSGRNPSFHRESSCFFGFRAILA